MSETSEEKAFEPSDAKLRNLRDREGSIPRSPNFVSFLDFVLANGFLWATAPWLLDRLTALQRETFSVMNEDFEEIAHTVAAASIQTAGVFVGGLFGFLLLVTLLLSIFANGGVLVAAKRITPDFNRLNPVQGAKNLFNLQAMVDFAKGLLAMLILGSIGISVLVSIIDPAFWSPSCDRPCGLGVIQASIVWIAGSGGLVLIAFAVADLRISVAVFRHEQRMTHSEMKREIKEQFQSEEIRQERHRLRDEAR